MQPSTFNPPYARMRSRSASLDGMRRPVVAPPPPARAASVSRQPSAPVVTPPKAHTNRWQRLQLPLIVGGSVVAGLFVQALWFGIALTLLYGVLTIILRIKSYVTFTLAIIALVTVMILMATKPGSVAANNFAAYAFLLLTIGVITVTFEVRPQKRRYRRSGR